MIPADFRGRASRVPLEGFETAARVRGIALSALLAVWSVECGGAPFLADGRPAILFEAHIFSRLTDRCFDRAHPALSVPTWDRTLYSGTRAGEYERLRAAMALSRNEALMAASWGGCQILGCNHKMAGFDTVDAMVSAFCDGEYAHLAGFLAFVEGAGLMTALRDRDWPRFSRGYNGTGYVLNRHAERLAENDLRNRAAFADGRLAVGDRGTMVERAQQDLVRVGHPILADGIYGGMTARAVIAFRQRAGLPAADYLDADAIAALGRMAA